MGVNTVITGLLYAKCCSSESFCNPPFQYYTCKHIMVMSTSNFLVAFVLTQVAVQGQHIGGDGVDGGVAVALVDVAAAAVVLAETCVAAEAYHVLPAPALPA